MLILKEKINSQTPTFILKNNNHMRVAWQVQMKKEHFQNKHLHFHNVASFSL